MKYLLKILFNIGIMDLCSLPDDTLICISIYGYNISLYAYIYIYIYILCMCIDVGYVQ